MCKPVSERWAWRQCFSTSITQGYWYWKPVRNTQYLREFSIASSNRAQFSKSTAEMCVADWVRFQFVRTSNEHVYRTQNAPKNWKFGWACDGLQVLSQHGRWQRRVNIHYYSCTVIRAEMSWDEDWAGILIEVTMMTLVPQRRNEWARYLRKAEYSTQKWSNVDIATEQSQSDWPSQLGLDQTNWDVLCIKQKRNSKKSIKQESSKE